MQAIATPRLRLIRLSLQDADAILHGQVPPSANWAEGYPADMTLVAAGLVVVAAAEGRDLGPWTAYQAVRTADDRVVAGLGFIEPPDVSGAVVIGFSETPEARAEDLTPEAVAALAQFALGHTEVRSVRADTAITNHRNAVILEAAGFRRTRSDAQLQHFEAS